MINRNYFEIENVRSADFAFASLLDRDKFESVGLGLFYGCPGLGKTRWAETTAFRNGYYYYRLTESATLSSFLKDLVILLLHPNRSIYDIRGTCKDMYGVLVAEIQSKSDFVIFIDEVDYALKEKRILATIRDFVDQSFGTFVLIGMERSKSDLLALNAHYFDRCNAFCEFKPLSECDTRLILSKVCKVNLDNEFVSYIHKRTLGTMRRVYKYCKIIKDISREVKRDSLQFSQFGKILKGSERC
jgi:replication-associated recombination protein RarA